MEESADLPEPTGDEGRQRFTDQGSRTLGEPAPAPGLPGAADPGRRLGPFRLIEEIGRGGQGTVHLATDLRDGQRVALKVLEGRGGHTVEALDRFRREAAITSRLRHPGICPVLDADIEGRTPWIAMRFVEGETLSRRLWVLSSATPAGPSTHAASSSGMASRESGDSGATIARDPSMDPETIRSHVAWITGAARALHAAHEAGVIHRDVKPGNIMVTREGEAVVLDFGLARIDEEDVPSLTRTGDLFGTPAYMSPEQLTRKTIRLDRRTDVWSLGAVLYECLTLRRPFDAPTREGLYQAILTREPESVRRRNPRIPRALAAIVETSLQKDRDLRYQTAGAMAADLDAFMAGEAVAARSVGPAARFLRWSRREPARAALLISILVALPIIAVLVTLRIADAPRIAAARQAELDREEDTLLSNASYEVGEGDPRTAVEHYLEALRMDRGSVEAAAGLALVHVKLKRPEDALAVLESQGRLLSGRRAGTVLRADALRLQGRHEEAGAMEDAAPPPADATDWYLECERLIENGHGGDAAAFTGAMRAATMAIMLSESARALYFEALAHAAGHAGDRETVDRTVAALGTHWPRASQARYWCGWAQLESGRPAAAVSAFREAARLKTGHHATLSNLGRALHSVGDLEGALSAYREAIRLRPDASATHNNFGLALFASGDLVAATASFETALRLQPATASTNINLAMTLRTRGDIKGALAAAAGAVRAKADLPEAHFQLGLACWSAGRTEDAEKAFRETVRLHPGHSQAHANLGRALFTLGRETEGLEEVHESLRLNPDDAGVRVMLGTVLAATGDRAGEEREYREAIRLNPGDAKARYALGQVHYERKQWEEAIAESREAVRLMPKYHEAHSLLGLCLGMAGSDAEALESLRTAIGLCSGYGPAHTNIGNILERRGDVEEAIVAYREAARLEPKNFAPWMNLARVSRTRHFHEDSLEAWQEAIRLRPDEPGPHMGLGNTFQELGRFEEALKSFRTGHDLGLRIAGAESSSNQRIAECERKLELAASVTVVAGSVTAARPAAELLELGEVALLGGRHLLAARWYREAFDQDARTFEDLGRAHRLRAARAAAAASAASEAGASVQDDAVGKTLREQARAWLESDLEAWEGRFEAGRARASDFRRTLQAYRWSRELAAVRDDAALSELPPEEQGSWRGFWSRVAEALQSVPATGDG